MKFTSIKQIPKEAIEMIDDVQWWWISKWGGSFEMNERMSSEEVINIANKIQPNGVIFSGSTGYLYIEPRELEDKTYGINLYKKIHGLS